MSYNDDHKYSVEYRLREDHSVLFSYNFASEDFAVPKKAGEKIEIDEKVYEIQQIVRKISTRNNMTTFVVYLIPRD